MHEQAARRQYRMEMGGSLALYVAALLVSIKAAAGMPEGALRTVILLAPMLPFLLAVWAVVRQVRRSDEFIRLSTLQNIAIAAAVTAAWTFTYGFMENAGYPRLSMFTVWPVMGFVWGALTCLRTLRDR